MKLWFKAKRYGWGWTPACWQGWLVLGVYFAVLIAPSNMRTCDHIRAVTPL